jgi:CoA:oxalate CoA-transferase
MEEEALPLADIRVLDLTRYLAGPFCTTMLADMGAEIIKIEPREGDELRRYPPYPRADKEEKISGYFLSLNRNKKSITLNLKKEQGKKIFKELVKISDVVVESYRPDVMERLGLEYQVLRKINQEIIYATITGFGNKKVMESQSPYWDRPTFDLIIQAMSGVMSVTGPEGGLPTRAGPSIGDIFPGALAAFGILAAVHKRERSTEKRGQLLDISMYDSMVYLLIREIATYSFTGEIPAPMGNKVGILAPYAAFEAKDGMVVIAVPTESGWKNLCKCIDRLDLIEHPQLSSYLERYRNFDDFLKPVIEEWTKKRGKKEIVEFLVINDVPAAEINTIADIFKCPHLAARNMLPEVDYPDRVVGKVKIPGVPIKFLGIEEKIKRAPFLGEHTNEFLSSLLGYTEEEIAGLKKEEVI